MRLSDIACKNAAPKEKAYKLSDGDGMYLLGKPSGAKYWRMNYRFYGKNKTLALGVYPEVPLKKAREKRSLARNQLSDGIDPILKRQEEELLADISHNDSFQKVALEWHERKEPAWSSGYAKQVLSVLKRDFFPHIGNYPIKDLTPIIMLNTLRKIEERGALDALHDARSYAGQIFRYAIATGRAERDVVADLKDAFKRHTPKHYTSLGEKELPEFFKRLETFSDQSMAKLGLKLILLTFTRTNEVRGARWDEFDENGKLWIIPAERMKMKRDHVVPLASQTLELLKMIRKVSGDNEYLFPGNSRKNPIMSNNTMLHALWDIGYKHKATVHGFRSTASTILHESEKFRSLVIERQLAHVDRNAIRASYNRAEYLSERREMMQWWADRLTFLAAQ